MLSFIQFLNSEKLFEDRYNDFINDPKKKDDTDSNDLKDAGEYFNSQKKKYDIHKHKTHGEFVNATNKARYAPLSKSEAPYSHDDTHIERNRHGVKITSINSHNAAQALRDKKCGGFPNSWCASKSPEKGGQLHYNKYSNQKLIQYRHPATGEIHNLKYGFHVGAKRHELADPKNMPIEPKDLPPHVQKALPLGIREKPKSKLSHFIMSRIPHFESVKN